MSMSKLIVNVTFSESSNFFTECNIQTEDSIDNHIMNLMTQCHILPDGKNILLEVDETSPNYIRPI